MKLDQLIKDMALAVEPPTKTYKKKKPPAIPERELYIYQQFTMDDELVREWDCSEIYPGGAKLESGDVASFAGICKVCIRARESHMNFKWKKYLKGDEL